LQKRSMLMVMQKMQSPQSIWLSVLWMQLNRSFRWNDLELNRLGQPKE
jgi:hypothetical protein